MGLPCMAVGWQSPVPKATLVRLAAQLNGEGRLNSSRIVEVCPSE